jgi:type III secretion protein V
MVRVASDLARSGSFDEVFGQLRQAKFEQLGIPLPDIHLQTDNTLETGTLQILLYQEPVLTLTVPEQLLLADAHSTTLAQALHTHKLPFSGQVLQWIDPAQGEALAAMGITLYGDKARIIHCLSLVIDRYAADFVGVQETRFLMDSMENNYAELVKEVQRQMPIGRIADVLQRLVGEGVSIRDLRSILEALIEWAPREKDPIMLAEYVRVALRRHIATRYRGNQPWISGWMLGDRIENMVRESIRQTAAGSYSTLDAQQNRAIIDGIRERISDGDTRRTVLMTAIDVRRFVRKIVEREYSSLHVLSFQELGDEVELRVIGNIDLIAEA